MWQAEHVRARLAALYPQCSVEILGMTTRGDQILDRALSKVGGKGLFVKELEVAMQEGRADLAVHSLKDVPMELPEGFALAAILEREDPRDAFVSNDYASLAELPHGAVVNFLLSMQERPGITAADRLCAVTTLSFDIAVLELLLPLTVGARIEIADPATAADGMELARLLDSSQASMLQATPATWRMLLDAGWQSRPGMAMLCGGEALPQELAVRMLALGGEVWNLYGPTETTIWSALHPLRPQDAQPWLGGPIDNTTLHIVGADLMPVPYGVAGELLPRLFDRFYRPDGNQVWGCGLGLSIVKSVADAHHMTLKLGSNGSSGLVVTALFNHPLTNAAV